MTPQDFSTCKIGDKLWSIQLGECEVIELHYNNPVSAIEVKTQDGMKGKYNRYGYICGERNQSLFFSDPNIVAPPQPKQMVKKEVKGHFHVKGSVMVFYPNCFFEGCNPATLTYEVEQ